MNKFIGFGVLVASLTAAVLGQTTEDPGACRNSAYTEIGGKCVQFAPFLLANWDEARYFCWEFGGELLTIEDFDFFKLIIQHLEDNELEDRSYWIGGSDRVTDGAWRYINDNVQVPMGTPFWSVLGEVGENSTTYYQEPAQTGIFGYDCLQMDGTRFLYFDDEDCNIQKGAMCEDQITDFY